MEFYCFCLYSSMLEGRGEENPAGYRPRIVSSDDGVPAHSLSLHRWGLVEGNLMSFWIFRNFGHHHRDILDTCKHPPVHTNFYSISAQSQRAETGPRPINEVMVCLSLCHEEFSKNPAAEGRKFTAETRSRAGARATGKQLQREILELLSWDLCCWNSSQIFRSQ